MSMILQFNVFVNSAERSLGAMDCMHWSMNIGTRHAEQEHGLSLLTAKSLAHDYYSIDLPKMPTQVQVLQ
jgi:hypothetical protein